MGSGASTQGNGENPEIVAEAQWVVIRVKNKIRNQPISVKNAKLKWGKFYDGNDQDNEVPASDINKLDIQPNKTGNIAAAGRAHAASGTEGTIDLKDGDTKICTLYWLCPWGEKTNDFQLRDLEEDDYGVTVKAWNRKNGALGHVDVIVSKY
ncbi:hypothetical protein EYZ11_002421 [Aspergillus tanneri]|uniref:Asp-hemolysin n=1 Tax=Aspergillus tanneri TaxID=1220188 RepID=A0A4S3JQQ9_9EURO|nr:uncharacterized protein ATNIH1004_002040 [Aspergillus tanneri]XP_033430477.1 uncharacterized protein ATNIH1004_003809 [Aspergillus tanneri]KAA8641300.1 hypothetical protein ATNIH1004_002040 [Aspergillus tanneri]KAA8651116.1 hypothetical protein ATNIH1004_003809 [Aspergillus tanneri]THC98069.1 hypothetical protein EYZ11_002421 [Aspergillus tanneri]